MNRFSALVVAMLIMACGRSHRSEDAGHSSDGEERPLPDGCIEMRAGRCLTETDPTDYDGDGYPAGSDCDDHDRYSHPGAHEIRCNGRDEDCNGSDFCPPDADGDGEPADSDCDDTNPDVGRFKPEVPCNGVDDDCNGSDFCDADGDGFPDTVDCDDGDESIFPEAIDIPCDGVDQDCIRGDCCADDFDDDGFACKDDCDDGDGSAYPGAPTPDGCYMKDLDCDGIEDGWGPDCGTE